MKRTIAAALLAAALLLPAPAAAFTPTEITALQALCRQYPVNPPSSNVTADYWQIFCRWVLAQNAPIVPNRNVR